MSARGLCATCRTSIRQSGRGRPARYCGTPCRRAAEYRIKRLNRRIERLEGTRDALQLEREQLKAGPSLLSMVAGHTLPELDTRLAWLDERLGHYEAELIEALAD